jgi:NitT/TauT family transport system substrate-binding protein
VSKRRGALIALAVLTIAATVASAALARPAASTAKAQNLTELKIALFPSLDYAPLFAGLKRGIWKKHGLDLKITYVFTGAGLFAAIVSGQTDLATNSPTAGANAISQGLPIRLVQPASFQPTKGNTEVLVRKDSEYKEIGDLAGKTVATINLQGLFHLGLIAAVEAEGKDPLSVRALAMSPNDEPLALAAGRLDAIVLQDPFLTIAKLQGAFRSLGNPFGKLKYRVPVGAFWTSNATLERKAELLQKFKEAWAECVALAKRNPAIVRYVIPKYAGISTQAARLITTPDYVTTIPKNTIGPMLVQMKRYGWVRDIPSYEQIVWSGA